MKWPPIPQKVDPFFCFPTSRSVPQNSSTCHPPRHDLAAMFDALIGLIFPLAPLSVKRSGITLSPTRSTRLSGRCHP